MEFEERVTVSATLSLLGNPALVHLSYQIFGAVEESVSIGFPVGGQKDNVDVRTQICPNDQSVWACCCSQRD